MSKGIALPALLSSSLPGLNELVPENLLAIFDENELEVIIGSLSINTLPLLSDKWRSLKRIKPFKHL